MWDTRSIIVRFRRFDKPNGKKIKEEPNNATQVKKEQNTNHVESKSNVNKLKEEKNNTNQVIKDKINHSDKSPINQDLDNNKMEDRLQDDSDETQSKSVSQTQMQNKGSPFSTPLPSITSAKTPEEPQQQPWVMHIKSFRRTHYNYMNYLILFFIKNTISFGYIIYVFFFSLDIAASSNTFGIGSSIIMSK